MNDACDQTRRLVRIASCHEHMNVRELAVQGSAEWIRTVNIAQAEAGEGGARTSTQEDHPALERPALTRSVQANGQPQRIGVLSTGVRFARGCDAGRARGRAGCWAGHRKSSAHWQNCGGRPLNEFSDSRSSWFSRQNTLVCAVHRRNQHTHIEKMVGPR